MDGGDDQAPMIDPVLAGKSDLVLQAHDAHSGEHDPNLDADIAPRFLVGRTVQSTQTSAGMLQGVVKAYQMRKRVFVVKFYKAGKGAKRAVKTGIYTHAELLKVLFYPKPADAKDEGAGGKGGKGKGGGDKLLPRTRAMQTLLRRELKDKDEICFQELAEGESRHGVAGCFFELLVLKTKGLIELNQDEAYVGDEKR